MVVAADDALLPIDGQLEDVVRVRFVAFDQGEDAQRQPLGVLRRLGRLPNPGVSDRRGTSSPQGGAEWEPGVPEENVPDGGKGIVGKGMAAIEHSITQHYPTFPCPVREGVLRGPRR